MTHDPYKDAPISTEPDNPEWCGLCEQYHDVVIDKRENPNDYDMDDLWEDEAPAK